MVKYVFDIEANNEDFFEDARLLGITAPIRNFHFCWLVNKQFPFVFRHAPELDIHLIRKKRNYFFPLYQTIEDNSNLTHYLYHNQFDGEYLLPEFKHMDFLWLMKGADADAEKASMIKTLLNNLQGVQLVVELTHEKIKNKGNMVF